MVVKVLSTFRKSPGFEAGLTLKTDHQIKASAVARVILMARRTGTRIFSYLEKIFWLAITEKAYQELKFSASVYSHNIHELDLADSTLNSEIGRREHPEGELDVDLHLQGVDTRIYKTHST